MSISDCEVTDITKNGFWLIINNKELFISFNIFPMFKTVSIADIFIVEYYPPDHLRWENLDIDIELNSLVTPDDYPLVFR